MFDTDVLVAALRSDLGASRQLLLAALDGRLPLLLSVPLVLEYEAVLTKPEQLEVMELTMDEAAAVLDAVVAVSEPVKLSFRWRPSLPDPQDDMVLETAVNGSADGLITFNQRHFARAAEQFHLAVLTPGETLKRLRSK